MSATPGSRAPQPAGGTDTRLLLDELDTLMQKMLALPVNQPVDDETPTPPKPAVRSADTPRVSGPEQPRAPHFIAGPLSAESAIPAAATLLSKAPSDRSTDPSEAPIALQDFRDPFSPPADRSVVAEDAPIIVRSLAPVATSAVAGTASSWAPSPLGGINRWFDRSTRLLGPLGRWLRSTSGRRTLGWLGVGLWLAAIVWGVLKWIG